MNYIKLGSVGVPNIGKNPHFFLCVPETSAITVGTTDSDNTFSATFSWKQGGGGIVLH